MTQKPNRFAIVYGNGDEVREGDRVLALGRPAVVGLVLRPGTRKAKDYCAEFRGGFLLEFDDGDRQVWPNTEDKIELIARIPK